MTIRPQPAAELETWHDEADVLVIGFGAAGTSAAFEAAVAGADVLVLYVWNARKRLRRVEPSPKAAT